MSEIPCVLCAPAFGVWVQEVSKFGFGRFGFRWFRRFGFRRFGVRASCCMFHVYL